jgi:uncharacterized membrane protein
VSDAPEPTPVDAGAEIDAAVASDGAYTLVVADFPDVAAAREAYEQLKQYTEDNRLDIEGVIVLSKDQDGTVEVQKATDYQTKRGLAWGVVGGVVLGVLFPPSIIGSAVVLGAAGAGVGRLRHRHYSQEFADELAESIDPGHSGIVALVSDPTELELERALAKADRIVSKAVDKAVAEDLKAEAQAAETPGGPPPDEPAGS